MCERKFHINDYTFPDANYDLEKNYNFSTHKYNFNNFFKIKNLLDKNLNYSDDITSIIIYKYYENIIEEDTYFYLGSLYSILYFGNMDLVKLYLNKFDNCIFLNEFERNKSNFNLNYNFMEKYGKNKIFNKYFQKSLFNGSINMFCICNWCKQNNNKYNEYTIYNPLINNKTLLDKFINIYKDNMFWEFVDYNYFDNDILEKYNKYINWTVYFIKINNLNQKIIQKYISNISFEFLFKNYNNDEHEHNKIIKLFLHNYKYNK